MIRVVLVDDQALFREGLRFILERQDGIAVIGEAEDGEAGLALIRRERPDVALLDIRMPRLDGIEVVRRLFADEERPAHTRVIVLTTFAVDEASAEAVRLGAHGYLLKDATPDVLTTAIRSVAAGSAVIGPDELTTLLQLESEQSAPPPIPPAFRELAPRERIVFAHLAQGRTNAEIARIEFVSEATIKTQVSSVLTKLALRDRVQVVIYAHENALISTDPNGSNRDQRR